MIISASRRTDIPAFYSDWFYNRIADGRVLVRNPYYPQHVSQYRLTPDVVDIFYFFSSSFSRFSSFCNSKTVCCSSGKCLYTTKERLFLEAGMAGIP